MYRLEKIISSITNRFYELLGLKPGKQTKPQQELSSSTLQPNLDDSLEEMEALIAQQNEQIQEANIELESAIKQQDKISDILAKPLGGDAEPTDEELEAELLKLIEDEDSSLLKESEPQSRKPPKGKS